MKRHLIVVDVETNGLDPALHQAVEVAWWNLDTDERGTFIPRHGWRNVVDAADLKALQINGYLDRIAGKAQDHDGSAALRLWEQFGDNDDEQVAHTLAGSNPAFDAAFLEKVFKPLGEKYEDLNPTPWHHRLWDLSAYAAGVLGLDELPGLATVCQLLDIKPGDHTAEGDVTATALCFRKLRERGNGGQS